ncbi:hypothetical protein BBO99_00002204 [Phytophthora kernoviae]|uniref:Calpain catalytic domain-containing protein n=1 Tax=Phytophthora kernoviae TaxID=325452 RepID=A0A421EZ14_9STRA|nr:hypothetical protein BBI17_001875 [Phytophthora kernoviae]RLN83372.1 hypothetical protein BBO99_00002204 [Phytophthora kernoviae]
MCAAMKDDAVVDLHALQEELKKLGISVVSGRQNTVISVKIKGLAGRALMHDRIPVFGFTDKKAGKPYFARCRNPNELWVSLLEKAYAKLHGSYETLIGGFVDCALNDLTGMCSEQIILKEEFPGFSENPYAPAKPQQKTGPWSDSSEERAKNEDAIEKYFKILKRTVGANAEKRVFMTINAKGKIGVDEISQEEIVEINANDGTFFMSFEAWMQSFTHFFAGIGTTIFFCNTFYVSV